MKKNAMFQKIVILSLITVSVIYASRLVQQNNTLPELSYHDMDITQLQQTVERRSKNGDLPFDMGCELIKRWTQR